MARDFSLADLTIILTDFPDLLVFDSPATRGRSTLDLAIASIKREVDRVAIFPSLRNDTRNNNPDQALVHLVANLKHRNEYHWIEHKYRHMHPEKIAMHGKRRNKQ